MALVAVTRDDLDSGGLRAAAAGGMDRQTLRDWVHCYDAHGIEGLRDTRNKGRAPALTGEQMRELQALVLDRPDLAEDSIVR